MANLNVNRLNGTLPAAVETTVDTNLTNVLTAIDPYTTTLVEEERTALLSLQEENFVFAYQALGQAQRLSNLIPPAMATLVSDLQNDLGLHAMLRDIEDGVLSQIKNRIADSRRLAGHEGYLGALAVYKLIGAMASMGVEGADPAYQLLKERFANQGGRPGGEENNNG